jgi:hypothetical protein
MFKKQVFHTLVQKYEANSRQMRRKSSDLILITCAATAAWLILEPARH